MNLQEDIKRIKEVMGIITEDSVDGKIRDLIKRLIDKFKSTKLFDMETNEANKIQTILGMEKTGDIKDYESKECVKEFQRFADLKDDGIVGPKTMQKIKKLVDGELNGWEGCKKTEKPVIKPQESLNPSVVGSGWKSCKAWRNKGGLGFWGKNFQINESTNNFTISYKGPGSGLSIAHAANGGDTLHQVYNVLICEINPFLAKNKLKPVIDNIQVSGGKDGKESTLTISVPLEKSEYTYQLDRRGGWNHNPGPSKMNEKCKSVNNKGGECVGPIKKVVQGGFGKITEYFITHTI